MCIVTRWLSFPAARKFFHWKFSGVFVPLFVSLAIAIVGLELAFESVGTAVDNVFWLAYVFLAAAAFWALGYWLTSDWLRKRNPRTWGRRRKASRVDFKSYRRSTWCLSLVIVLLFGGAALLVREASFRIQLTRLHGYLVPASDPLSGACGGKPEKDQVILLFENDLAIQTNAFPFTVLQVRGKPALVLSRDSQNRIAISADIYSRDGRIVTTLDNGQFTINPHNYFKKERRDLSSLVVVDQENREVLNARYLNSREFMLKVDLYYPGVGEVKLIKQVRGGCFNFTGNPYGFSVFSYN